MHERRARRKAEKKKAAETRKASQARAAKPTADKPYSTPQLPLDPTPAAAAEAPAAEEPGFFTSMFGGESSTSATPPPAAPADGDGVFGSLSRALVGDSQGTELVTIDKDQNQDVLLGVGVDPAQRPQRPNMGGRQLSVQDGKAARRRRGSTRQLKPVTEGGSATPNADADPEKAEPQVVVVHSSQTMEVKPEPKVDRAKAMLDASKAKLTDHMVNFLS